LCSAARRFVSAWLRDILQGILKNKNRKLAQTFNSNSRYIDAVLSLNNSRFSYYIYRIYVVKDTTDTQKYASYVYLHLEIDSEGRLKTKLYDKRDDFTLPIVNFSLVEVIATTIIRSSSQNAWPVRNMHISNDRGSFTFSVDFRLQSLYIWMSERKSYIFRYLHNFADIACYVGWIIDNHKSVLFSFGFQRQMMNMILHHCTGYQNSTSVHTTNDIWWELPSVLQSLFLIFKFQQTCQRF
jgi:hypothetical protein